VIRFDQRCGCTPGRVIGHGGLCTGMNEAVLLKVPGLHVKFRFAGPRTEGHEANTKVRHEWCCVEYPFQFLALQLVEFFHVLGAFLGLTGKRSGAPKFTNKGKAFAHGHSSLKLTDQEARPPQHVVRQQPGELLAGAGCVRWRLPRSNAIAGHGHREGKAQAQPIASMGNGRSDERPHSLRRSNPKEAPTKSRKISEPWQDYCCQTP